MVLTWQPRMLTVQRQKHAGTLCYLHQFLRSTQGGWVVLTFAKTRFGSTIFSIIFLFSTVVVNVVMITMYFLLITL